MRGPATLVTTPAAWGETVGAREPSFSPFVMPALHGLRHGRHARAIHSCQSEQKASGSGVNVWQVAALCGFRARAFVRRAWSQVDGGTRVLRPTLAGDHRAPPPWPHQHRVCHAHAWATANGACARGHHRRPAGISGGLPRRSPRCLWGRWFGCAIAGPIRGRPGGGMPKLVLMRLCQARLGGSPRAWAGERIPGPPARAPIAADLRECPQRAVTSHPTQRAQLAPESPATTCSRGRCACTAPRPAALTA